MSQPPAPRTALVAPMLVAAVLGGGVAAGVTTLLDDDDGGGTTTTVVRQAAIADTGAGTQRTASQELTAADVYEKYAPGVVYITADVTSQSQSPFDPFPQAQQSVATGSGFVIDKTGDILTNNHVIDGATKISVRFADKTTVTGKVVGRDPSTDLALLQVDPKGLELDPLPLGSSKGVSVGDPTIAIGNPFGLDRTLTTGVVSALQREIAAPDGTKISNVIQTDAAINPGNSGGPLIDATGRVIGINSQIETAGGSSEGNVGIGFAVPVDTAKGVLSRLKSGANATQTAYVGVEAITVDRSLDALSLPVDRGALVQTVAPGSPADAAGIRAGTLPVTRQDEQLMIGGDVITGFDGHTVTSAQQLTELVAKHKPGDEVDVELVRRQKRLTVTLTLGERPASTGGAPATTGPTG